MLKLLKLSAIGLVVAAGASWLVFGSHTGSYLRTAAAEVRAGFHDQVPVEFELKRAESLIQQIEPQLREARRELAQSEVDLERVEQDIDRLTDEVTTGDDRLRNVTASLSGGGEVGARYALASHQRNRAELQLERLFDSHRNNVALLQAKQKLVVRHQQTVDASRNRLDAIRVEKARLEDMVVALRMQKRNLDAMAASARTIELDDTPLSRAREALEEVKNKLDVHQKMVEDDLLFAAEPQQLSDRDIIAEVQTWMAEAEGPAGELRALSDVRDGDGRR